ncbi:hypothetical protein RHGRI_023869 [Rhododendron griersonianum]|uniref:Peptidase A1 domain-containing protein n=1 Tax=Rhododendron griersonianum TaxID=479676 RepID=A0AAV6J6C0_9ERIC|nr:hypothetical protein RHGRI_023869 [Rhododendron griersonianum]
MAEKSFLHPILFVIALSLHLQSAISRTHYTTTVLDVSASIQRTLDVLSFDPQTINPNQQQEQQNSITQSSSFSVSLHPRSSLHKHHHKDYTSLTRSRLARDSARVQSIAANLELALSGVKTSDLKPLLGIANETLLLPEALQTPVTSGEKLGSGEYFSRVGVGRPARQYYLVIDTGSDVSWIQCKPCFDCYQQDNEGLFAAAAGLLGMGGGSLSLPSQLRATSFSYCLVNRDSAASSTLEFNSARPGDSVTAPLLRNSKYKTFFYVGLAGLSVGGQPVAVSPSVFAVDESGRGGIIVDSGTAVTRLKTEAYTAVRDAFARLTTKLPSSSSYAIFDTCYDLSSFKQVSIPTVSFRFAGGKSLTLPPENYMIPVDSAGKVCFAFAPTDGPLSIIGNIQQQGTRVSYDVANSVVGFSPSKC